MYKSVDITTDSHNVNSHQPDLASSTTCLVVFIKYINIFQNVFFLQGLMKICLQGLMFILF